MEEGILAQYQKRDREATRFERAAKLAKARQKDITETMLVSGISIATSFGSGLVMEKFPDAAKIPGTEIDTDLVVGAAALVGGLIMDPKQGKYLSAVAVGLMCPWANAMGRTVAIERL